MIIFKIFTAIIPVSNRSIDNKTRKKRTNTFEVSNRNNNKHPNSD